MAKYTYKRKRTFKKKRVFKRKRKYFKKSKYNQMLCVAAQVSRDVVNENFWNQGKAQGARFMIDWLSHQPPGPIAQEDYSIALNITPEWNHWRVAFAQYRLSGMKIQFQPFQMNGRTISQGTCHVGTFPDALEIAGVPDLQAATQQRLAYANDYHTYQGGRGWKRYYNIAKFINKHKGGTWFRTDQDPTFPGVSENPQTIINMDTGSAASGDRLGTLTVTYYIKFRNPPPPA